MKHHRSYCRRRWRQCRALRGGFCIRPVRVQRG